LGPPPPSDVILSLASDVEDEIASLSVFMFSTASVAGFQFNVVDLVGNEDISINEFSF